MIRICYHLWRMGLSLFGVLLLFATLTPLGPMAALSLTPDIHYQKITGRLFGTLTLTHLQWGQWHAKQLVVRFDHGIVWALEAKGIAYKNHAPVDAEGHLTWQETFQITGHLDRIPFDWLGPTVLSAPHPAFTWAPHQLRLQLNAHRPTHVHGHIVLSKQTIDVQLAQQNNRWRVKLDGNGNGHVSLNFPNLKVIYREMSGQMKGDIDVTHHRLTQAHGYAHDVRIHDWWLKEARLTTECTTLCHGQLTLKLPSTPMITPIDSVTTFKETQSHHYQWHHHAHGLQWSWEAHGQWHHQDWQHSVLELRQWRAQLDQTHWQLKAPATLNIRPYVDWHQPICFMGTDQSICWNKGQDAWSFRQVPLTLMAPFLALNNLPITNLKGLMNGHLHMHDLHHLPSGTLKLTKVKFHLPTLGTTWDHGELTLRTHGHDVDYHGQIQVQHQRLKAEGHWATQAPHQGRHHVFGQAITLINHANAMVDGDLDLHVDTDAMHHQLSGQINLTRGYVIRPDFSAMTTLPSNTQIVGETTAAPLKHFPIKGQVGLNINHGINLELLGVHGVLGGHLTLQLDPFHPIRATGSGHLSQAKYLPTSDILVENATIHYDQTPLHNPMLNIVLTRQADVSTQIDFDHPQQVLEPLSVSLRIGGVANAPTYKLTASRSDINQTQMLSALLSGHTSLNAFSGLSAASSLTLNPLRSKDLNPISRIRKALRLDEFTLSLSEDNASDAGDNINHPSIIIRKNIDQNVSVYSKIGLDNDAYTMALIYRLSHLFITQFYVNERAEGAQILYRWNSN